MSQCENPNYVPELFEDLARSLREASRLPSHQDFSYFKSFSEFSDSIVIEQAKVEKLLTKLSDFFGKSLKTYPDVYQVGKQCLITVSKMIEQIESPVCLKESLTCELPKPQNMFKSVTDNSYWPYIPRILYKYHAKTDVPAGILKAQQLRMLEARGDKIEHYEELSHPYEHELNDLRYLESQFTPQPSYFSSLEACQFELIETEEQFYRMIQELRQASEISVDLENHSIRSYLGFCCLMQISTRTKDYIIDPFQLQSQMPILGVIFADPLIVKVFHGSDNDIEWLQRDFGLYIINLFDTFIAAKSLRYPSCSLAFLIKSFCDIDCDKRYQLADWRLRPLTPDMIKYARSDTHYLLYIYDRLREELIHKSLTSYQSPHSSLEEVLEGSRKICLKIYQKPVISKDPSNGEYYKLSKARDFIARLEDESPEFILPHTDILAIAGQKPGSVKEMCEMSDSVYLRKYSKYFYGKIQQNKASKSFSNDFFADADWKQKGRLPFTEVYEAMRRKEINVNDILAEVSSIMNSTESATDICEGKTQFDVEELLKSSEIDENSLPRNLEQIFELSNNSRKKNKNKNKAGSEPTTASGKASSVNLHKVLKEVGWAH